MSGTIYGAGGMIRFRKHASIRSGATVAECCLIAIAIFAAIAVSFTGLSLKHDATVKALQNARK